MEIETIKEILKTKYTVRDVEYKTAEDKAKYGLSFEAITSKDFEFITVNGLTLKAKRIIEEFSYILFIYNGQQVTIKPADIETLEITTS